MRRAAAVACALAALALPAASQASTVRTFAVGPRISPDWIDTRAHFHDKLLALTDARERGRPGVPPVAAGAGDVASHLRGGGRDLVVLPEDVGLLAAFTGSRGASARAAGGLVDAVVALIGSYGDVSGFYTAKYPSLGQRPLPTRLLAVSLTDTFGRVAVETFAELADRLNVTLVAGVNMARSWRIVCTDKASFRPPPGATGCDVQDPALVARLRSPDEPQRDYAYEATTPDAVNMALVFGPDGRLIGKQVKAYLTPIELPTQLDLQPGSIAGVHAIATPAGRIGIATSKDAWMPDVVDRLEADGAQLLIQPEFFVGDTVKATGMWAPDNLKAAGYSDVLRHPGLQALALPSLTGNLFDFAADAQSHVALEPLLRGAGPRGALVGQDPAPGFAAVMPFGVPDPAGEPIVARRRAIAAEAAAADPAAEGTVFSDVTLNRPGPSPRGIRASGPFSAASAIAPSRYAQRDVSLAARGPLVVAAWQERSGDRSMVRAARSTDGGRSWSRSVGLGRGRAPSVAIGAHRRVWVARTRSGRVLLRASGDGARHWSVARAVAHGDRAQSTPSIAATAGDRAYLAWIDERGRQPEGGLPRAAVYGARVHGEAIGAAHPLDAAAPTAADARQLDNDWAVSVGARGRDVTVAWADFRSYDWRIVGRSSRDGGARFRALRAVSDDPVDREALDDAPSVAVGRHGAQVAWTDYVKAPDLAPAPLYDVALARLGRHSRIVDGHGAAPVISVNPALALTRAGAPLVAFQDHARGVGAIRLSAGGRVWTVSRSTANQWQPAIARSGRRVLIAWQDARGPVAQVRLSGARLSALG